MCARWIHNNLWYVLDYTQEPHLLNIHQRDLATAKTQYARILLWKYLRLSNSHPEIYQQTKSRTKFEHNFIKIFVEIFIEIPANSSQLDVH